MVVATLYAPIILPSVSILVFREKKDGTQIMIATGSLLSANPDRITVKRAVLSGAPFKVHKKSAVVRFMFFNREDIDWFKPVELRSKYGRQGHIRGKSNNLCTLIIFFLFNDEHLFDRTAWNSWTHEVCV